MKNRLPRTFEQLFCLAYLIVIFIPAIYLSFKFNPRAYDPSEKTIIFLVVYGVPLLIISTIYAIFNRASGIGGGGILGIVVLFIATLFIGNATLYPRESSGYMLFFSIIILWAGSLISLVTAFKTNG